MSRSWIGILFAAVLVAPISGAEIQVQPRGLVPGSVVLLGDVARITGVEATEIAKLKRLELFPAPARGDSRMVRRTEIREILQLNEIDLARHRLTGASTVRVTTRYRKSAALPKPLPTPDDLRTIVVTARPLARGERLRESDVVLKEVKDNTSRRAYLTQISDAVGMELKTAIAVGRPVESRLLRRPLLVKKNQVVRVVARAAGVAVRTEARAMQDGALGDLIILQSLSSRERYSARVTGPNLTEVYATGVQVSSPSGPPREFNTSRLSARSTNR